MIVWTLVALAGSGVRNPGGDRIPFVKLRSEVWDIVIRRTGDDRARIERVKARCQGIWVNACAAGVDPQLRQLAMRQVFQEGVTLSGDFTYCSTAVVRNIPADMARKLVRPSTDPLCQIFLDPSSVRDARGEDATTGENDLVGRLMGGSGTTSGKIRMKPPPGGRSERVAAGERRTPGSRAKPSPSPTTEAPSRPVSTGPTVPEPAPEPMGGAPEPPSPSPDPPVPEPEPSPPVREAAAPGSEASGRAPAESATPSAPAPDPNGGGGFIEDSELDEDVPVFVPPEPEPAPEPLDPELEALLAPIPTVESQGALPGPGRDSASVAPEPAAPEPEPAPPAPKPTAPASEPVVPAPKPVAPPPKPAPPPPDEFALEEAEMDTMEPISSRTDEEDKKRKKGRKKKGAEDEEEDLSDYIIIDIEGLPEDE